MAGSHCPVLLSQEGSLFLLLPCRHVGIESALKRFAGTDLEVQAGVALPEQASLLEAYTWAWGAASSDREEQQHRVGKSRDVGGV